MNWLFKKIILLLLVVGISVTSFANCFGKFALTRKVYGFVEGIGDKAWAGKIIRTILMYLFYVIPLVAMNEYNKEGKYVKSFSKGGETLKLTYLNFGQKLVVDVSNQDKSDQFIILKTEPGKFFKERDNKLEEISISAVNVGPKMILKMATGGKLESSKVIDAKDYKQLEQKYAGEIY